MPGAGTPTLSIVLTARNERYGADFRDRLFSTLRVNHRQLAAVDVPHEFVFVEWAPLPARPWLADLVRDALPELGSSVLSAYVVDPRYHEALSLNPRVDALEFLAKNVGIRRARGRFILTTNCDVYLGRAIVDAMAAAALQEGTVYRARSCALHIPAHADALVWSALDSASDMEQAPNGSSRMPSADEPSDFLLADRNTLHELRGFNEVYRVAGSGIDRNFLVKTLSAGVPVADVGGPVYYISHPDRSKREALAAGRDSGVPRFGTSGWPAERVIYRNPTTWGLSRAPVRELASGRYLDFAWEAIPSIVDLRRIALPVARRGFRPGDPASDAAPTVDAR
jgi:hypothetical protein